MSLDDRTDVLIAVGASAAVNCRYCVGHYLEQAKALNLEHDEVAAAVGVGLRVNRGAAQQTRIFTSELLTAAGAGSESADQQGCGCQSGTANAGAGQGSCHADEGASRSPDAGAEVPGRGAARPTVPTEAQVASAAVRGS